MDHLLLVVFATVCLAALFRRSLQQLSCYILVALIVSIEGVAYFIFQTSIFEHVQQDDKVVRDCVPLVFQSKPTAPSSVAEICTPYRKRKPMMRSPAVHQIPKDQYGSGILRPRYTSAEVRTRDLERIQRAEASPTTSEPTSQPPGPPPSNGISNNLKLRHRIPPLPFFSHPRCNSCGQSLRKSIFAKANLFVARKAPPKSVVTYRKSAVVKSTSAITPSTLPLHPSSNLDVFIGTTTYEEEDRAERCRAWVLQDSDQTSPVAELTPSEVDISTEAFSPPLQAITSTPPASKVSVLDLPILASPIQSNLPFEPLPASPPEPEAVVPTSPPVFKFDVLPQSIDISNPIVERDDPSPVPQQDVEPTPDPILDMTPVFPIPSPPIESDINSFSVKLAAESGLGIDSPADLQVEPASQSPPFDYTPQSGPAPSPSEPVAVPTLAFLGDAVGLNESAPINSLAFDFGALSSTPQPEISPSATPLPPPIQQSTPFNVIQKNLPDNMLAFATHSQPLPNVDVVKSTTRVNSSPVQAVQPTPVGRASPAATQSSRREASGSSSTRSSGTAAAALASTFYLKQFERDYDLDEMKKKLRWIFEEQGGDHDPNCFMDFRLRVQFDPEKFDLHRFFEVYPQHKDSTVDTKTDLLCLVWDNRPHMLDPFRHSTLKHYAREQKRLARRAADNSGR
ncbi:hypothetical protein RQP46_010020 [Phenoliferia psychrophenolica]